MLDKELNKLRDKTLSFGCIIGRYETEYDKELTTGTYISDHFQDEYTLNYRVKLFNGNVVKMDSEYEYEVIGHPLTRGRIEHYYRNHGTDYQFTQIYNAIKRYFEYNGKTAFGQSEIERQTHEKRPELKKLLIQFSNYL